MNCFQIIIFVLTRTASGGYGKGTSRCELLSNHYLCANKNSGWNSLDDREKVVNCFQIIIFVLTRTARFPRSSAMDCCELLSNHYLCANKNSPLVVLRVTVGVVNCFQIIIFVLTRTASPHSR